MHRCPGWLHDNSPGVIPVEILGSCIACDKELQHIDSQHLSALWCFCALQSTTYSYNYVTWSGGADAYQTCDLSDRASTYVGTCTTSGFVTFNTTLTTDATDTSLTDVTYTCSDGSSSATCAAEADQLNWCTGLCYCGTTNCTSTEVPHSPFISLDTGQLHSHVCCSVCVLLCGLALGATKCLLGLCISSLAFAQTCSDRLQPLLSCLQVCTCSACSSLTVATSDSDYAAILAADTSSVSFSGVSVHNTVLGCTLHLCTLHLCTNAS